MKTDLIVELRRLYEAAPRGEWAAGQIDGNDYILQPDDEYFDRIVCLVDDDRFSNLIIAMHEALLKLLDAVDTLSWYADEDNYGPESGAPGQWENASCESGQPPEWDFEPDNGERARAALAALKRSGEG